MPDPMVQNTTNVTFDVTVPAYQSNELQLRLNWGEISPSFSWIGDEFWSIEVSLPSNTEHLLTIVFYDENGGIELGSFEQQYTTGTNAAEVFRVNANQFDTEQWDVDKDGNSNLQELIAGTDPRVDEASLLPIVDNQRMSLLFIANYLETQLPTARPYAGTVNEIIVPESDGIVTISDIDRVGNGSLVVNTLPEVRNNVLRGERVVLENGVRWSGTWGYTDDYILNQSFTSETTFNGVTHQLVETGSGAWTGTVDHRWTTTVDVTGRLIDGTAFCQVDTGMITQSYNLFKNGRRSTTTTVSRASSDDLWRVSIVSDDVGVISTQDYFARELSMHMILFDYQNRVSVDDYFICDFADL